MDEVKYSKFWWGDDPEKMRKNVLGVRMFGFLSLFASFIPVLFVLWNRELIQDIPDEDWAKILLMMFFCFSIGIWGLYKAPWLKELSRKLEKQKNEIDEENQRQREEEEKKEKREEERRKKEEKAREKKERLEEEKEKKLLINKYGKDIATKIINKQLFIDMTKEMLIDTFGPPIDEKETVTREKISNKYYYFPRQTQQDTTVYGLEVTLEDGIVSGWKDLE